MSISFFSDFTLSKKKYQLLNAFYSTSILLVLIIEFVYKLILIVVLLVFDDFRSIFLLIELNSDINVH